MQCVMNDRKILRAPDVDIGQLLWDSWNPKHATGHGLSIAEVETLLTGWVFGEETYTGRKDYSIACDRARSTTSFTRVAPATITNRRLGCRSDETSVNDTIPRLSPCTRDTLTSVRNL